jgi:hypothetical protein
MTQSYSAPSVSALEIAFPPIVLPVASPAYQSIIPVNR